MKKITRHWAAKVGDFRIGKYLLVQAVLAGGTLKPW